MRSSVGMSGAALLRDAEQQIAGSPNIEHWQPGLARWDARSLLAHVLGVEPDQDLRALPVNAAQRRRLESALRRRVRGEPVNYIIGRFDFCGLELLVRPGVFSPRASSELTVTHAVMLLRRRRAPRVAVDVATGSGAIALAVAAQTKAREVWGLDISADAVRLGRANARRLQLNNVHFRRSDMLTALPSNLAGGIDLFTIHPPYVARHELDTLPVEIRRFEPRDTLTDGSEDGLGLVRRLADEAPGWLRPGGSVLVEVAPYLSRAAGAVLRRAGLSEVRSHRDSLGATRVVAGRLRTP